MAERKKIKEYDVEFLKRLMREMLLCRRFEETAEEMYGQKKIGGFLHVYSGQEAVTSGSIANLDLKKDAVITGYRDHAHAICCNVEPRILMAELFGKVTGCARGKGGSMHFFSAKNNMYGGNGIVGSQIPVATGIALKMKYKEEDGVVLCYFGDGAIHQGAFHESLNLAKVWQLPIVYICENNHYAMGTEYTRVSSVTDFSVLARSYNMKGKQINGMDVLNVYEEVNEYIKLAKQEHEPTLIEAKTYRFRGHSVSDPAKYRTKDELKQYQEQGPISLLKQEMMEAKLLTDDEFKEMDNEAQNICQEAVKFADESDEPAIETIYEDIYA